MRRHVISLYTLIVILLISQTFMMYMFIVRTSQLSSQINKTYFEMKNSDTDINSKIGQISSNLLIAESNIEKLTTSQSSFERQISEIKATTSADFSGIIESSLNSVVAIVTDVGQGTGFIINEQGYIVTNAHVLYGAHYAKAITSEKESINSDLIGYDLNMDIAILKIPGSYSKLELGDSDNVKIGEKVIAIGNPLGLSFSATEGIISARDRIGSNNLPYYFQTDVALNPGNSGGPLINTQGEVIGINNFKIGGAEAIGFALESNYIEETLNNIATKEINQTIV